VGLQVPLVEAFVRRYATQKVILECAKEEPWRPALTVSGVVTDLSYVCARYGAEPKDFETVARLISLSRVGSFLEHPLFYKLALADYA
jgi:hypothetical protein